jgi:PDZ domain-containing secreted protein
MCSATSYSIAEGPTYTHREIVYPAIVPGLAKAHIEQGDVLTSVNGSPLMRASDFAQIVLPWYRGQRFTSTHGPIVNR